MKKLFALALLLSFGVMVGCGEEKKTTGATKASGTAKTSDTGTPAPAKGT